MRKPRSIHTLRTSVRLSLQFSILYAVLSAAVFTAAYWFTHFEVKDYVQDQMQGDAETLRKIYEDSGADALARTVDALTEVNFESTRLFQLVSPTGDVISGNIADPLTTPLPFAMRVEEINLRSTIHDEVEVYWMRADAVGPFRLVQGSGDQINGEVLEALATALLTGYVGVIVLGVIAGVRVGRMTEQRITQISNTLSLVSQGQLDARITSAGDSTDDLSRVSREINAMLDQVKRLLESQEQISNDIAHDMRTPLQRLRQRLEAMRERGDLRSQDVDASLEQTDEIISTFNALLRIAQIEAANKTEQFEPTSLDEIAVDVAEMYQPMAEDRDMRLTVQVPDGSVRILGDRELVTQLMVNLVENALVHCPKGTEILLSVSVTSDAAVLAVSDNGPGIEPALRDMVLRRFFRAERSRSTQGNGLGLALVKAIADIHLAEIQVLGNDPGTVFQVRFRKVI